MANSFHLDMIERYSPKVVIERDMCLMSCNQDDDQSSNADENILTSENTIEMVSEALEGSMTSSEQSSENLLGFTFGYIKSEPVEEFAQLSPVFWAVTYKETSTQTEIMKQEEKFVQTDSDYRHQCN